VRGNGEKVNEKKEGNQQDHENKKEDNYNDKKEEEVLYSNERSMLWVS